MSLNMDSFGLKTNILFIKNGQHYWYQSEISRWPHAMMTSLSTMMSSQLAACQNDETSLPPKEDFYSKFTGEGITDDDYQHAQTVCKEFSIESMKDYYNLCNLSDVLLLADVIENFRNICMNHYGLDPAWYFSAPGLAWDATFENYKDSTRIIKRS